MAVAEYRNRRKPNARDFPVGAERAEDWFARIWLRTLPESVSGWKMLRPPNAAKRANVEDDVFRGRASGATDAGALRVQLRVKAEFLGRKPRFSRETLRR